jgi:putative phosphoserine phosphatase / 1-acylglycerol-3-phosphate O-acyltransferase
VQPADAVANVLTGEKGPHVGAFFDFDGTVIQGYSAGDFYGHRLRRFEIGLVEAARTIALGLRGVTTEADFERFAALGFAGFAGRHQDELDTLGERLFVRHIAGRVYPEAWQLIRAHERMGHTIAIASSASRFQVEPAARALGVEHVLCTPLEVGDDGVLSGRADGPTLWREGKAQAVRAFAAEHGIDLDSSYAYSNGDEDIPFLSTAGQPHATNPGTALLAHSTAHGWPVLRFAPRGRPPLIQVARTVAAYGGITTAMGTGLAVGLLNQDRQTGLDVMMTLAGELALGLAGVRVNVIGEQNLWSQRPAVFLFNHQSQLDMPILCRLLRRQITAVAKQELASHPLLGPAFRAAGVAFIDRAGETGPKAALAPAVEKLTAGTSVLIAPEGTRSLTPALGEFKRGAFHLARQARVPVVPIVIRNAGALMWRDAATIRPGTVDIVVHEPISTTGWTARTVGRHADDVRQLYLDTLANWPGTTAQRKGAQP